MKPLFIALSLCLLAACSHKPFGIFHLEERYDYDNDFVRYSTKVVINSDTIDYGSSKIKIITANVRKDKDKIRFMIWQADSSDNRKLVVLHGGMKHPHYTLNSIAHRIANNNINCLFLDSRGYGLNSHLSKSFATKESEDLELAMIAYKKLLNVDSLDSVDLIILTTSLAGSSAIDYARKHSNVKAVIFESLPYDSEIMIKSYLNFFERMYFNIFYCKTKKRMQYYNPKITLGELSNELPLYFFWSSVDDVITKDDIEKIKSATDNNKRQVKFHIIPKGTHAIRVGFNLDESDFLDYMNELERIIANALGSGR